MWRMSLQSSMVAYRNGLLEESPNMHGQDNGPRVRRLLHLRSMNVDVILAQQIVLPPPGLPHKPFAVKHIMGSHQICVPNMPWAAFFT